MKAFNQCHKKSADDIIRQFSEWIDCLSHIKNFKLDGLQQILEIEADVVKIHKLDSKERIKDIKHQNVIKLEDYFRRKKFEIFVGDTNYDQELDFWISQTIYHKNLKNINSFRKKLKKYRSFNKFVTLKYFNTQ